MNSNITTVGQKGSDVYTIKGLDNPLVALSALLTRGVTAETVSPLVQEIIEVKGRAAREQVIEDLCVLAFQTRDIRGGKGERDASFLLFNQLLSNKMTSGLMADLLDLVPDYGCWQDLFKLFSPDARGVADERIKSIIKTQFEKDEAALAAYLADNTDTKPVEDRSAMKMFCSQWTLMYPELAVPEWIAHPLVPITLARMRKICASTDPRDAVGVLDASRLVEAEPKPSARPNISLLAKWMPREGQICAGLMSCLLVPGPMFQGTRMKQYRKRVAALNKFLQTVEVKMCAGDWEEIVPGNVPGRAVKKYVKAFLNEKGTKRKGEKAPRGILRHPCDPVRMACREHFQKYFSKTAKGEVVAKGADTIFPHEIIKKATAFLLDHEGNCCPDQRNHFRGIWNAMVAAAKEGGGLGRSLAMCDFSGSMRMSGTNGDTPYWVSMALGLLISEVTTDEFKDCFLTFDSTPTEHVLPQGGDLFARLKSFRANKIGNGTSTDFQKAMDLVLKRCKEGRVKPGNEPTNLIVLTDMAWDEASGSNEYGTYTGNTYRNVVKTSPWQFHVEMIRESFKRAGEDMWGEGNGWKMPTIVIWNIAATCQDFHAKADTEGVVMLSGWSPSLFKVLQTKGVMSLTPEDALLIQLGDARYNLVRQRVKEFFSK